MVCEGEFWFGISHFAYILFNKRGRHRYPWKKRRASRNEERVWSQFNKRTIIILSSNKRCKMLQSKERNSDLCSI